MLRFMAVMALVGALGCGASTVIDNGRDDTTSSSTTAGTGAAGGAVSTTTGGGVGGAGGAGSEGPWRADMWIGQVDHLSIRHHSIDADVCVLFTATAPSGAGNFDITMPMPWGLDSITAWDDTSGCMDEQFTPVEPSAGADPASSGSIDFSTTPMQLYPCTLDVDVIAQFDSPPLWLPPALALEGSMIEVAGACP
jgi:hypothetical protein